MARVEGVEALVASLRAREQRARQDAAKSVAVGFTAGYAIYVHEDMEKRHPVGQAKFLEQPARTLAPVLRQTVADAVKRGLPLPQALLLAGLRLQRAAQELTPVKTGALRASAFTAFA